MPRIFICYRREDSSGQAGRLFDRMKSRFGDGNVFMDMDGIEPGEDFVEAIERTISNCSVAVVVIGRQWQTSRLHDPNDVVRLEIERALTAKLRVIPYW